MQESAVTKLTKDDLMLLFGTFLAIEVTEQRIGEDDGHVASRLFSKFLCLIEEPSRLEEMLATAKFIKDFKGLN